VDFALPDLHQVALGRYEQGVKKPPDPTGFSKSRRPYPSSCRNRYNPTKKQGRTLIAGPGEIPTLKAVTAGSALPRSA
jgi:hypothetical protein